MTETTISTPSLRLRPATRAALTTLGLIAIGDTLLLGHSLGISLPLLIAAIALGIVLTAARRPTPKTLVLALVLTILAVLPLIETPSWTGSFCALVALSVLSLLMAGRLPARLSSLPFKLFGFALLAPFRWIEDTARLMANRSRTNVTRTIFRQIVIWLVPLGCAGVFVWLFSSANPLIESVLAKIDPSFLAQFANGDRIMLWIGLAVGVWPLLMPRLFQKRRLKPTVTSTAQSPDILLFGQAAILRSLLLFNAIFAVQTVLDLTYLWGGVALPGGISHADYAHRGAYPLIATALLAGAFVLAAMRPGGAGENNRLIRWLVYAWIAQNIMLCISSILRLDLYVEVYSLTELRIAAGIWMALVGIGLGLILARIALRKANAWLVATNCAALLATLYACAFVDFSAVISEFNISHSYQVNRTGVAADLSYLRQLGPSALPALDRLIVTAISKNNGLDHYAYEARAELAQEFIARDHDWRSWTLRDWRLEQYLATPSAIAVSARTDDNWTLPF